jgi:hypothetical protein
MGIGKEFLKGQSFTIFCLGGENSGKSHCVFGSLRDPGLSIILVRDVFNDLFEKDNQNDYQIKLSFIHHRNE